MKLEAMTKTDLEGALLHSIKLAQRDAGQLRTSITMEPEIAPAVPDEELQRLEARVKHVRELYDAWRAA